MRAIVDDRGRALARAGLREVDAYAQRADRGVADRVLRQRCDGDALQAKVRQGERVDDGAQFSGIFQPDDRDPA